MQRVNNSLVTIILLLVMSHTFADTKTFIVKDIGEKDNHFPYLVASSKGKQNVAENINIYLHLNYLELLPKSYKLSPFEKVNDAKRMGMPRLGVYSFDVSDNNKFISVHMNIEGCGAYCESSEERIVFLASNGRVVPAKSLFTVKGLDRFNEINHKKIQKTIKAYLNKMSADKASPVNAEDENYLTEAREMYEECLQRDYKGNIHEHTEFTIHHDRLTIYSGRCSNHAMRALDDIGEFKNTYVFNELKSHLSPLGVFLLDKNRKNLKKIEVLEGVYKGKISNKYPIGLFIQNVYDDGSVGAVYWYEKYKEPISLSGEYKNGTLTLYAAHYNELEEKWIKIESFIGSLKENRFNGSWNDMRTGRSAQFDLFVK